MPLLDGKTIRVRGGKEMILPPLDVYTIRKFTKDGRLAKVLAIGTSAALPTDESWQALVELLLAAFRANYPHLTEEDVEKFLDLGCLGPTLEALFVSSGFRAVPPGEGATPSP